MDRNLRKEFPSVEVVFRKRGKPDSGRKFVALLQEVAAFVNFSEKKSKRDVVGDVSFNARHLAGAFVEPDHSFHLRKNRSGARRRFVGGVRVHAKLQKLAATAGLFSDQGKEEC